MNIVDSEYIGILYMGILKCACLKQPIFSAIKNSPAPSMISITMSYVDNLISLLEFICCLCFIDLGRLFIPLFEY